MIVDNPNFIDSDACRLRLGENPYHLNVAVNNRNGEVGAMRNASAVHWGERHMPFSFEIYLKNNYEVIGSIPPGAKAQGILDPFI